MLHNDRIFQQSRYARLGAPPSTDVTWTSGFWAQRFSTLKEHTLDAMWAAMNTPGNSVSFDNFYKQAGLKDGEFEGVDWGDGDCYKWMEAVARVNSVIHLPDLDCRLDELIAVIAQAQDSDGYINTQIQLTGKKRWSIKRHHEDYNFGHLLTAASVHHRLSGKQNFLDIAIRAANYLYTLFVPPPRELVHFGWNPSNIMGLVDLYHETQDRRYLELADIFLTMRGSHPEDWSSVPGMMFIDPGDQNQDRVPLRDEKTAVGHCVTAMYLYAGAADIYAETGEQALFDAMERIWQDVTTHKMYLTGGTAALYHGTSCRHDQVHEAFGLEYQLPNANAYNETCATIGNAMWNWRLLKITGEARFADVMETVIYNGMLAATSLDGTRYFYCNPLRFTDDPNRLGRLDDVPNRWVTHDCFCCPPQVARSIAWMHEWVYGLSQDEVWVNLYAGSRLDTRLQDGAKISLVQETNYPWHGDIKIQIEDAPPQRVKLQLRIPGWADGLADEIWITVNGEPVASEPKPGTYLVIDRHWQVGDVIHLHLPVQPRLIQANPLVEEARNQLAVQCGPVLYCLEGHDLPEGVDLLEVYLPIQTNFEPSFDPQYLGGIGVLHCHLARLPQPNWKNHLYHFTNISEPEIIQAMLIPYFAWANRGKAKMSVFLPAYYGTI